MESQIVRKEKMAIVIPMKDMAKLSPQDRYTVEMILSKIDTLRFNTGRALLSKNRYIVVNQDEPYASALWDLVLIGEKGKNVMPMPGVLVKMLESGDWILETGNWFQAIDEQAEAPPAESETGMLFDSEQPEESLKALTKDDLIKKYPGYALDRKWSNTKLVARVLEINSWLEAKADTAILRDVQHRLKGMSKDEVLKWVKGRANLNGLGLSRDMSVAVMSAAVIYFIKNADDGGRN